MFYVFCFPRMFKPAEVGFRPKPLIQHPRGPLALGFRYHNAGFTPNAFVDCNNHPK
jgi:hypothetical protein